MNFKQAYSKLLEGKKIRRKGWKDYYFLDKDIIFFTDGTAILGINVESALADDWEVIEESKVWSPKKGEKYWYIFNAGDIVDDTNDNSKTDEDRFSIGNYFKTQEEAKHMVEKLKVIKELKDFALENNEEEIDWNNEEQKKYSFNYNLRSKEFYFITNLCIKESPASVYFTSEELAKQAIEKIGEDRIKKYYFDIKEK